MDVEPWSCSPPLVALDVTPHSIARQSIFLSPIFLSAFLDPLLRSKAEGNIKTVIRVGLALPSELVPPDVYVTGGRNLSRGAT